MTDRIVALPLILLLAAYARVGGVSDTPPAPTETATTVASTTPDVTETSVVTSTTLEEGAITEAEVAELEALLDEVDDTESLIEEPLPEA
ncbi:MAG: hypothetical protein WD473_01735 [Acidimicrobiia bacterium]